MLVLEYVIGIKGRGGALSGFEYKYVASKTADAPAKNCLREVKIQQI
jgi:hypothetical protein